MRKLLFSHWEKLFLLAVLVLSGWSLYESLGGLGTSGVLSADLQRDISKIKDRLRDVRPKPDRYALPDSRARLAGKLVGKGFLDRAAPKLENRICHPEPLSEIEIKVEDVPGKLGLPRNLAATADRGVVALSWTAPLALYAKVAAYQVFKRSPDGTYPAEAFKVVDGTSLRDTDVKPQTEYFYQVKAVGQPVPPKYRGVIPPAGVKVFGEGTPQEGWVTEAAGPVSAKTPSNIEFICLGIFKGFDSDYARLTVRRWVTGEGWIEYETGIGIAEGEPVIGTRRRTLLPSEEFKTGYVVDDIELREVVETWIDFEYVEDPPGSGKFKKVRKEKTRKVEKTFVHLKQVATGETLPPIEVGAGKPPREEKEKEIFPRPRRRTPRTPTDIEAMRERIRKSKEGR